MIIHGHFVYRGAGATGSRTSPVQTQGGGIGGEGSDGPEKRSGCRGNTRKRCRGGSHLSRVVGRSESFPRAWNPQPAVPLPPPISHQTQVQGIHKGCFPKLRAGTKPTGDLRAWHFPCAPESRLTMKA